MILKSPQWFKFGVILLKINSQKWFVLLLAVLLFVFAERCDVRT